MSKIPHFSNTVLSAQHEIPILSTSLTASLKRPGRKTLTLIDKALRYLIPFESPKARTASPYERQELLDLLNTHRRHLSPYLDTDRVESNLRKNPSIATLC